jgi:penicillin-binding protein 2
MALLTRQKKMRLDPDAPPKPGKRPSRAEQVFVSRRMLLARSAIVGGFATLAARLGYMQVVEHQVYADEAEKNIKRVENIKSPRGLIYDRTGRLLAENRRTWEVRVVPADLPEDEVERRAVLDQLINALALPDALVLDPNDIPRGQEETVYQRLIGTMISLGMAAEDQINGWFDYLRLESGRNYLVLVEDDLKTNEAAVFRMVKAQLPGVYVMNVVDFLIGNSGDPRIPVPIKTGVPKDIALRLEANRLLMPGVQTIDNVLIRKYHGGPVMSHVLGYARRMTADLYERHRNDRYEDEHDPTGDLVGQLIYEEDDTIGQDGIENNFEAHLRGVKGKRWIEVDSHGVEQRELSRIEPQPGKSLKLTLDLELQQAISKLMPAALEFSNTNRDERNIAHKYPARTGAVVAIDPRDGSVLAMVSYPHYDNQLFVDGISERQYKQYTYIPEDGSPSDAALFNRAIAAQHPSGSIIKPFLAISALKDRKITPDMRFDCKGAIFVPSDLDESKGQAYPCPAWEHGGHGPLNVFEAIERSCDIFFYNVGTPKEKLDGASDYLRYYDTNWARILEDPDDVVFGDKHYFDGLGIELIHQDLKDRFWFGRPTQIDLPGELAGIVPDNQWKRDNFDEEGFWSAGDTINISIGQGYFQTTPLQMAVNTAALANNGKVWKPRLVEALLDNNREEVERVEPKLLREIRIMPEHYDIVREGMHRVVHSDTGSAHSLNEKSLWQALNPEGEEEIQFAGKTGTAEVGKVLEDGTYDRQHAWFTCFAPFDNPEIALAVVVEEGGEGGRYAVPIADKVLRAYFEITGRRERVLLPALLGEGSAPPRDSDAERETDSETEPDPESEPESSPPASDGTDPRFGE